ncbi:unnamed protein product [Owenia fusiformis]|uniref:Uncharacterized protein n=1 Tax=Owenia fusiformis TaxID=6347 RepID=A0A8S4NPU8_OWEFU|nr:unnamed protein product [Owenia fusiformis]
MIRYVKVHMLKSIFACLLALYNTEISFAVDNRRFSLMFFPKVACCSLEFCFHVNILIFNAVVIHYFTTTNGGIVMVSNLYAEGVQRFASSGGCLEFGICKKW